MTHVSKFAELGSVTSPVFLARDDLKKKAFADDSDTTQQLTA